MRQLRALLARIAGVFAGRRADHDLDEELQSHLDMATAEYIRRGMDPAEARRQALIASGGMTQAAEAVRDRRGLPALEGLAADLRYALRALRHSPGFTLVVVLTLALGIGANTAIFSVVRAILLKPLPHRGGDRLVYLRQTSDRAGPANLAFSVPEVRDFRNGAPSLAGGIAEYSSWSGILQGEEEATRIATGLVTGNFFDVMGLAPVRGRLTRPGDDGSGVPAVMVLSYEFWINRFGGDTGIVGRQVRLDNSPVTVIGVLEPAPFFPNRVDAFLNMVVSPHHLSSFMVENRSHRMTEMIARLAPGASVEGARAEVAAVYGRMRGDNPAVYDSASHYRAELIPFQRVLGERARLTLWLLMAAAAFVMIIAGANVANLTLMRGVRREHELVTRAALGAGVGRLRRLLLAENLLLAIIGAAMGVAIATFGVELLRAFAGRFSPRAGEIRLDGTVLGFALALSVLLALLLSAIAALPKEGTFATWIAAGGHRASGGRRKQGLQRALVVTQIAVSVVLMACAALLNHTMIHLSMVRTGLTTQEVLTMQVSMLTQTQLLTDPAADIEAKQRYERMRSEIAALPGVRMVGVGSPMPLRRSTVLFDVKAEDRALDPGEVTPNAELRTANPEFFRAAGIPLVAGREFAATDQAGSTGVVIINQALVARLFPGQDPVGRRIAWTGEVLRFAPISGAWRTIVGVVANTQDGGPVLEPRPVMYMPFTQMLALGGGLVIHADSNAEALIPAATRIVRRIAPTAPIENVMTITQYREQTVSSQRLNANLISSFSILAVLIAAVGIAGVLAFSVSARTSEIGIRMSLGADGGRVQRMILKEGSVLLVLGLVLGLAGSVFATRAIRGLLFGVTPGDPGTYAVVAATMVVIGMLACWIPALRASRIDPAITMRNS